MTPSFGQPKPASSAVSATAALPRTRPAPARQAAAIAYRAAGSPSVSGDGFADADAAGYYAQPALWAKQIGAVSGSSFQPDSACSKAQLDALIGAIAA